MGYSLPGSSAHWIFQARILEGVPFPSPGDLPDPGIELHLLHWQAVSLPLSHQASPAQTLAPCKKVAEAVATYATAASWTDSRLQFADLFTSHRGRRHVDCCSQFSDEETGLGLGYNDSPLAIWREREFESNSNLNIMHYLLPTDLLNHPSIHPPPSIFLSSHFSGIQRTKSNSDFCSSLCDTG